MMKEMKLNEVVMLGNNAFNTYLKGLNLNKKLHDIKHVHGEIVSIVGHGLQQTLILKGNAKKYLAKCQALGLEVKAEGPFGVALVLSDQMHETEIIEKVALLNKVFYEVKAENAN